MNWLIFKTQRSVLKKKVSKLNVIKSRTHERRSKKLTQTNDVIRPRG